MLHKSLLKTHQEGTTGRIEFLINNNNNKNKKSK